ncbi:MAG: hypothetical protein K2Y32_17035 [Candidatus Obscuribacterales bacterium]|nr:hypothetical protein [Candidatus Obscuribacterales bacterium]
MDTKLFRDFFAKRTFLTPAGQKPRKELGNEEESRDSSAGSDDLGADFVDEQDSQATSEKRSAGARNDTASDNGNGIASGTSNRILEALKESAKSVDELSSALGEEERSILVSITELELEGLILRLGGGRYSLTGASDLSDESKLLSISSAAIFVGSRSSCVEQLDLRFLEALLVFAKLSKVVLKGVSRKYLRLYIAAANEIVGRSIQADALEFCLQAGYVGSRRLKQSVTGPKVEFVNQVSNSVQLSKV